MALFRLMHGYRGDDDDGGGGGGGGMAGVRYAVSKVKESCLTLSPEEFQRENINLEDLLSANSSSFLALRETKIMSLCCDAIGRDGLNVVARYLRCGTAVVSLRLDDNNFQGPSKNNTEGFVAAVKVSHLRYLSLNVNLALHDQLLSAFLRNPPPLPLCTVKLCDVAYNIHELSIPQSALILLSFGRVLLLRVSYVPPQSALNTLYHRLRHFYGSGRRVAKPVSGWQSLPLEIRIEVLQHLHIAPFLSLSQYASVINYAADQGTLESGQRLERSDWLSLVGCTSYCPES